MYIYSGRSAITDTNLQWYFLHNSTNGFVYGGYIEYDIIIKYWINSSDKNRTTLIQSEVEKAIDEYKKWQRSVMGRDINPDEIIQRLKNAGAKRLEISSPVFTVVGETQVARERNINCQYAGLEDG